MHWIWRALVLVVLVGAPLTWLPASETDAAFQPAWGGAVVHGPADGKKDDPEDLCDSGNPRKQKKCHRNGWDLTWNQNNNDNGDEAPAAIDPQMSGTPVTVDGLTVALWRSSENPVLNTPMALVVKGDGAAIERVWWWAEGPVYTGPFADDLAFVGTMTYECNGAQPCAGTWQVVSRYLGPYMLHARIRDTSGREVQTDWKFETVEKPG
ncbi:MAG: hypothetical protein U0893_07890 [Chloroflexota bacterium]